MASTAIVKRKGSDTSYAIVKRPKLFLDTSTKECFEFEFKSRGICAPREEFYSNLAFSEEEGELMGRSMIRGKRVDLTAANIRSWIGAAKKLGGASNGEVTLTQLGVNETLLAHVLCQLIMPKAGWEPDLIFIILNQMKDMLALPTANLPYGSLITLIARARGVVFEDEDWVGANV
ncbi:uncharacterized protein G2W53_021872 [Senna tora]|uniref:Uncharacterized protein n=1 Tax=Senna tora TaxID=362788 RepID=A0A834WJZ1_9FABA|nr:uncharacterized protein G2W53_021872 [Senna tora]